MNGIAVLLLTALLILGSAGWGLLFQVQLKKISKITSSAFALNYLQIPIGISLFLLVFGWLVALGICSMWSVLLWHFLGVTMLAVNYILSKGWKRRPSNWSISLINTIILVVCSLASLGVVASRTFQKMDDLPAYAYLAQKLVATGGLIDPFSSRRILSYGGATLYQAVFVKFTGLQSIFAFDNLFMPVVLVITVLLYGRSHKLSPWLLGLLSLCLVAGTSSLILFNLSPRFAITFFTLVVLLASFDLARSNSRVGSDYVLVMGLLIASLSTMRVENAVAPAIVVLLTIVWDRRSAFRHALLLVGIGMLSVSGWAFALYRSSGTFLFPIMRGTANMSFYFDPVHWGISQYLTLFWNGVALENEFAILIGVFVAALCSYLSFKKDIVSTRILVYVAGAVTAQLIVMVFAMTGYDGPTVTRYSGPTILAAGIFTVVLLFLKNKQNQFQPHESSKLLTQLRMFVGTNMFNVGAVFLIFLCCLGYTVPNSARTVDRSSIPLFSTEFRTTFTNAYDLIHKGALSLLNIQSVTSVVNADLVSISKVSAAVPKNSTVLSAIETPGFLDMSRFNVFTLDWPSANSEFPGLKFDQGVQALKHYLIAHGINFLLIQRNDSSTIYDEYSARIFITAEFGYKSPGEAVIQWDRIKSRLLYDRGTPKRYFSNYALIELTN